VWYRVSTNLSHGASWHEHVSEALATGVAVGVAVALSLATARYRVQRFALVILGSLLASSAMLIASNLALNTGWNEGIGRVAEVAVFSGLGAGLVSLFVPTSGRRTERTA